MPRPMGRPQNKVKYPGKLLMRLINYIFRDYKVHCIAVFILIFVGVIANVQGTMFTRDLIDKYITPFLLSDGTPNFSPLAHAIERVAVFYGIGIVATYAYNRIMINVTQGMMMNMRNELFEHMEKLPIKYFDTHAHGDIMSIYTNDIDTLRQMVSQSIPQLINSVITIVSVLIESNFDFFQTFCICKRCKRDAHDNHEHGSQQSQQTSFEVRFLHVNFSYSLKFI